MTEVIKEEPKKDDAELIFSPEDIKEMFDGGFLEKFQLIGSRLKEHRFPDKKIAHFMVNMTLQFEDQEKPLIYSSIKDKINLLFQSFIFYLPGIFLFFNPEEFHTKRSPISLLFPLKKGEGDSMRKPFLLRRRWPVNRRP